MKVKLTEDIDVEEILLQIESNMPEGFEIEPFEVLDESTGQYSKVYFDITEKGIKFRVREKQTNVLSTVLDENMNELKNLKEVFEAVNEEDFKAKNEEKEKKNEEIQIKNEKQLNELSSLKNAFESLNKEKEEVSEVERELLKLKELYTKSEITLFEYNDRRRKLILNSRVLIN